MTAITRAVAATFLALAAVIGACDKPPPFEPPPCPPDDMRAAYRASEVSQSIRLTGAHGRILAEHGRPSEYLPLSGKGVPNDGHFSLTFLGVQIPTPPTSDRTVVTFRARMPPTSELFTLSVGDSLTRVADGQVDIAFVLTETGRATSLKRAKSARRSPCA